ncbi:cysteine hydrolase family protein [Tautonia marina]|uniref:cysteine hydrolase family protein n=1 Tax=Tautonia marina TaxID=2653855 RepID=UPI001260F8D4|nr:isochorismatase family cysteine hydrolase [Tautonia marina]
MQHHSRVFVDVDTQRDFLDHDGSLFIRGSEAIRPNLARLTAFARDHGIPIIATACAHELDEPDPEPFPPHCLVGTPGADRVDETRWPNSLMIGPDDHFEPPKSVPEHLTLQKRRYEVFSHPEADRVIAWYGRNEPTFVVYGVATDYCVACAVRGLRDRGYRVAVVTDAIEAVDPSASETVLAEFDRLGVERTTTDAICGSA